MGRRAIPPFSLLSGEVLGLGAAWAAKGVGGSQDWQATTSSDADGYPIPEDKTTKGYALLLK